MTYRNPLQVGVDFGPEFSMTSGASDWCRQGGIVLPIRWARAEIVQGPSLMIQTGRDQSR